MGSALRASEGPRGQVDVRGHHLPNGGRVLEASGRERIGLVITTGPDYAARGRVSVIIVGKLPGNEISGSVITGNYR